MNPKEQAQKVVALKNQIASAKKAYEAIVHEGTAAEVREASDAVRKAQKELSDVISHGADPCPTCGQPPMGMVQYTEGGPTFEVGCTNCGWFKHTDGTPRDHSGRGGVLPHHTVEAWNMGPDYWRTKPQEKFLPTEWEALPTLAEMQAKHAK